ncbi:replicative DNA helicase, partial [Candidatus Azambacteria bacterium]|nr:replicative DNA helicase [Candidatus Azambacteria bacterium]
MALRNPNNMGDKIPPQNIEAEQSVLGALLLDKEAIVKVVDALETRDFYQRSHQIIYETILHLFERQEPIDLVNVANRLKAVSKLEEAGGMGYLTTLVNAVSTPAHIASHAKIVHHKRVLRDLISVSYDISGLGYREDEDPDVLLDEAEQKIFSISKDAISQEFVSIKNALEEAFGRIERLHQDKGELRGVATGYTKLDNILGGLQRSDLIILASRPSLGKTSLALNIALNVATKKKLPVGIFSLEMSKEQVVDRFIATEAHVDLWKLRTGKLTDEG